MRWSDTEVARATQLRDGGMTAAEIGAAMDRSPSAVRDMFYRRQPSVCGTGPIWIDMESVRMANDAVRGSARLKAEIERVFGA